MTNNGTCQRELGTKNKTFLASNFIPIVKPFWSDFHFSTICHFLHLFVWCCCVHVCLAQFTCLCQRELVTYDTVKQLQRTGTHQHLCGEPGGLARLSHTPTQAAAPGDLVENFFSCWVGLVPYLNFLNGAS